MLGISHPTLAKRMAEAHAAPRCRASVPVEIGASSLLQSLTCLDSPRRAGDIPSARKPAEPGAPTARGLTGWRGPGPLVAIVVANRSRLSRKRSRKCVLSLEILISLAYRKKRRQVRSLGWQFG